MPTHKKSVARYVDGYVLPVPKTKIAAYRKMAQMGAATWRKHGALNYKECVGEDLKKHPWGMSFNQLVKPKKGETIVFAYIEYKNRAHRDKVNKAVMKEMDEYMKKEKKKKKDIPMPFDMKRMAYGGFEVIADA